MSVAHNLQSCTNSATNDELSPSDRLELATQYRKLRERGTVCARYAPHQPGVVWPQPPQCVSKAASVWAWSEGSWQLELLVYLPLLAVHLRLPRIGSRLLAPADTSLKHCLSDNMSINQSLASQTWLEDVSVMT